MEFFKTNSKRREVLLPLFEWRYLGLSELREASNYKGTRQGLSKMMQRLEKDGLVESFLHLYANRKFYHLTKATFKNYSEEPWYLNQEIRNHDAVASSFLFQIRKVEQVTEAYLNFPIGFFEERTRHRIIETDGFFNANINGALVRFALEIEINRKSSAKIESKYDAYYKSQEIDGVIYVFNDLSILEAYYKYHEEFLINRLKSKSHPRIGFCFTDHLGAQNFDFLNMKRISSEGKLDTFGSLFL